MKRRTFYHISLSLPYVALILSGGLTYLVAGFDSTASSNPPGIFLGSIFFFSISAIVWGPLYTWMVVVMLIWGRGKGTDEIRKMYLFSPILLACGMGIPVLLISFFDSALLIFWGFLHLNNLDFMVPILFTDYQQEQAFIAGMVWGFVAAICIVVGYTFVGMVLLIEKTLQRRGLLIEEPQYLST